MPRSAPTPPKLPRPRGGILLGDAAEAVATREVAAAQHDSLRKLLTGYFWWILKNVVGWLLIISAPVLGIALPGPGGIPVFLIGFALVTFPGKRRITTRFMRGRRLPIESPLFTGLITFFSVLVTASLMILGWRYYEQLAAKLPLADWRISSASKVVAICLFALPTTMLVTWVGLRVLNYCLGWVPRLRRLVRPMLRKFGVRLLPTRRKRIGGRTQLVQDEILSFDDSQRQKVARVWAFLWPWLRRLGTVSLTVGIIYFLVAPVVREWPAVEARIGQLNLFRVGASVAMFAVGYLLFRVVAWQAILLGLGRPVPTRAAARIWSLAHLARYVPGPAHLLVRAELTRRYGPTAAQANVAHRLEGTLTLLAALLIGTAVFWGVGYARLPHGWRPALVAVAGLSPLALLLAVPSIFYRLAPPQTGLRRRADVAATRGDAGRTRLRGPWLAAIVLWLAAGLVWQGLAVWLLVGPPLQSSGRPWLVVGAWCVGWVAGHLAPWSPGGLGVREIVFVAALSVLLPQSLRDNFAATTPPMTLDILSFVDPLMPTFRLHVQSWQDVWWAFLFFLALLLRLATTAAEFLLAVAATLVDWRGVLDHQRRQVTRSGNSRPKSKSD